VGRGGCDYRAFEILGLNKTALLLDLFQILRRLRLHISDTLQLGLDLSHLCEQLVVLPVAAVLNSVLRLGAELLELVHKRFARFLVPLLQFFYRLGRRTRFPRSLEVNFFLRNLGDQIILRDLMRQRGQVYWFQRGCRRFRRPCLLAG
jgi:hypothetical protein